MLEVIESRDMPTRWKLKEFLEEHEITAYRLAQETAGQLSTRSIYNLVKPSKPDEAERIDNIRLKTLDILIPALRRLTGKNVTLTDLLDYEEEQ